MKKLLSVLLFLSLQFGLLSTQAQVVGNYYPYTLSADKAHTSAAIYNGSLLVRTLWADAPQKAGTHYFYWDGKDDNGMLLPAGSYTVKLSSNNYTYTWGVIANTSTNQTGPTVWRGGTNIVDMYPTGSYMRCAQGFSEMQPAQRKFNLSTPQQAIVYTQQPLTAGQGSTAVCANANYVFWGGFDYFGKTSFVFGERLSDEHEATFSAGTSTSFPPPNRVYSSVLSLSSTPITGIAIEKGGNQYLVVCYASLNLVRVLNIANGSGSVVQALTIPTPGKIAFEADNALWIAQGTTVTKYAMNTTTGMLTATASQITGFASVCGLSVLNGDLCVLDAGNQQILKRYNSSTLSPTGTIGQLGGYANSVAVADNKFYLSDLRGQHNTFVRHAPDGSIWIGDTGNLRCQHFAADGTFIESIMYMPLYNTYSNSTTQNKTAYNINLVNGSSTSVFNELLEFSIDYTKPIGSCWTLINNYNYNVPPGWVNTTMVDGIAVLSNGRRYTVLNKAGNGSYIAELMSTGLRVNISAPLPLFSHFTKSGDGFTTFSATNTKIAIPPATQPPSVLTYNKYTITGFDVNNNPHLSSATIVNTLPAGYTNGLPQTGTYNITTSKKVIVFDNTLGTARDGSNSSYYHLNAYDSTSNALLWAQRRNTYTKFQGDIPPFGMYDIGNGTQYQGGTVDVVGNNIITNDRGEFFKNSETSLLYHYDDNGLLQSVQGTVGPAVQGMIAPYAYFPNCIKTNLTSNGGKIYGYFNDESSHAGIHRWMIDSLSTYSLQTFTIALGTTGYVPVNTSTDLLTGTPAGNGSTLGTPGWSQSPASDITVPGNQYANGQFWTIGNIGNYDGSPSIRLRATSSPALRYLKRTLLAPPTQPYWSISGKLGLAVNSFIMPEPANLNNPNTVSSAYIEVGDGAGKIIARVYLYKTGRISFNKTYYGPFSNPKYGVSEVIISRQLNQVYLSMKIFGTQMTATQNLYDPTADISNPAYISFNINGAINSGFQLDINKLSIIN